MHIVVQNLFEQKPYETIIERLEQLTASSQRVWGKMTVSQMLAHCKEAFKVPLSEKPLPKLFPISLIGPFFKKKLFDDTVWKHGLPTAPSFIIKDERNFEKEKKELLELVNHFYIAGPSRVGLHPHPVFGKFTPEQWGKAMWKHLDHHLRQFGV